MNEQKTIIYVGGFELPDKNAAAHRVLTIGKIFREIGYNVVFIGISNELISKKNNVYNLEQIDGFDCWSIPYPKNIINWVKYLTNIEYVKTIAREYGNVSAIVCYNYQSIALKKVIKFGEKNHIKIISDVTEWYKEESGSFFKKLLKNSDTKFRMENLNKKVDGLIAISDFLFDFYSKHVPTIIVPPLVDKKDEKWQTKINNADTSRVQLIYAGSPGKDKDKLNHVISALQRTKNKDSFGLKIIGLNKEKFLEYYPESLSDLNKLQNSVVFLGRLPHLKVLEEIKKSDFSIFFREPTIVNTAGFPTKFVESLSSGIPVITNSTSNISEYLINGKNGFLIKENLNVELSKILEIPDNDLKKMKLNVDEQQFDYRNFISEVEKFINVI